MNDLENQLLKQLLDRVRSLEEKMDSRDRIKPFIGEVPNHWNIQNEPCMHQSCPACHGTGMDGEGRICVHHISCPCPRCSARY